MGPMRLSRHLGHRAVARGGRALRPGGRGLRLEVLEDRRFLSFGPPAPLPVLHLASPPPVSAPMSAWTVMVYLDGDNNLEESELEKFTDIAGVGSSANVYVVVQIDRAAGYSTDFGAWTGARRGLVQPGDTPTANWGTSIGAPDMGSPATLSAFVNWAATTYPAEHYALILSDHGGGVNEGVCAADSGGSDDWITTPKLGQALAGASPHLDVIAFDACLMGMTEVAYQLRSYADVMVASEQVSYQMSYAPILTPLEANPGWNASQLGSQMVDAYRSTYGASQPGLTMSAIDLGAIGSATSGLGGALADFANLMLTSASGQDWTEVLKAHDDLKEMGSDQRRYYDVGQWMTAVADDGMVSPDVAAAAEAVNAALQSAVIDNYAGSGVAADGLSIYAPFAQLDPAYDPKYLGGQVAFVADTRWAEFVGPLGNDVVITIDQSASMSESGKLAAAQSAADQFIDLMNPGDKVAVVSYSTGAQTDFPLTRIDAAGTVQNEAKAAVDQIAPSGATSIGAGVAAANQQLAQFPNDPTRAMLVMTDGLQNTDPEPLSIIQNQVNRGITIDTIGFGADADGGLLSQMAGMRDGQYYAGDSADLAGIYFAMAGRLNGQQLLPSAADSIAQGGQAEYDLQVESGASRATLAANWSSGQVDFSLVAPDGQVIDPSSAASNPDVSVVAGATYTAYTVAMPAGGTWRLLVNGTSVPSPETVHFNAMVDSPVQMTVSTDAATYYAGEMVHLQAALADDFPITGGTVQATIQGPAGSALDGTQVTLYDDGAHGDGAANDGVYAANFGPLDLPGSYTISVNASGTSFHGDSFVRYDFLSIAVPDVAPPQIVTASVSPATIPEGGTITLAGTFTSSGIAQPQVTVVWGDGGQQTVTLADGARTFSIPHRYLDNPASGSAYTIEYIVADDSGQASGSATATVTNVPPAVEALSGPNRAVPFEPLTFSAAFTDPGVLDTHTATIDWGDGSPAGGGTIQESAGKGTVSGWHDYTALGTFTIKVTVTDNDGASASTAATILVSRAMVAADPLTPGGVALFVGGGSGNESITLTSSSHNRISVSIPSLKYSAMFQPTKNGHVVVYTGPGNDTVRIDVANPAVVFAGGGKDRLFGGSGSAALVGGAGDDYIKAGSGPSLLIGGGGKNTLIGSSGADLLIGGTTDYDANLIALGAIMAEWTAKQSIDVRISHLSTGGGLNGSVLLTPGSTVHDDQAADQLYGGSGADWFLLGSHDKIYGFAAKRDRKIKI